MGRPPFISTTSRLLLFHCKCPQPGQIVEKIGPRRKIQPHKQRTKMADGTVKEKNNGQTERVKR